MKASELRFLLQQATDPSHPGLLDSRQKEFLGIIGSYPRVHRDDVRDAAIGLLAEILADVSQKRK